MHFTKLTQCLVLIWLHLAEPAAEMAHTTRASVATNRANSENTPIPASPIGGQDMVDGGVTGGPGSRRHRSTTTRRNAEADDPVMDDEDDSDEDIDEESSNSTGKLTL